MCLYKGLLFIIYFNKSFSFTMCLYMGISFTMCLYRGFSFTKYLYRGFSFTICLYRGFSFSMSLCRGFLLCSSTRASCLLCASTWTFFVLFILHQEHQVLLGFSYCRNYVFESIGLTCFRCVLDSFTNCPKRTSSYARTLKIRICGIITF